MEHQDGERIFIIIITIIDDYFSMFASNQLHQLQRSRVALEVGGEASDLGGDPPVTRWNTRVVIQWMDVRVRLPKS